MMRTFTPGVETLFNLLFYEIVASYYTVQQQFVIAIGYIQHEITENRLLDQKRLKTYQTGQKVC